jgi:hypothetical protein
MEAERLKGVNLQNYETNNPFLFTHNSASCILL